MTFPWLTVLGLIPLLGALVLALPVRAAARGIGIGFALAHPGPAGAVAVLFVNGADLACPAALDLRRSVPGGRSAWTAWAWCWC